MIFVCSICRQTWSLWVDFLDGFVGWENTMNYFDSMKYAELEMCYTFLKYYRNKYEIYKICNRNIVYILSGNYLSHWADSKFHPFCSSVIPMSRESRDSYSSPANTRLSPGIVSSPNLHRYIRFAIVLHSTIIQDFCGERENKNFFSIFYIFYFNIKKLGNVL